MGSVKITWKFQFAHHTVDFARFQMSESVVEPLPSHLRVTRNFPLSRMYAAGLDWSIKWQIMLSFEMLRCLLNHSSAKNKISNGSTSLIKHSLLPDLQYAVGSKFSVLLVALICAQTGLSKALDSCCKNTASSHLLSSSAVSLDNLDSYFWQNSVIPLQEAFIAVAGVWNRRNTYARLRQFSGRHRP